MEWLSLVLPNKLFLLVLVKAVNNSLSLLLFICLQWSERGFTWSAELRFRKLRYIRLNVIVVEVMINVNASLAIKDDSTLALYWYGISPLNAGRSYALLGEGLLVLLRVISNFWYITVFNNPVLVNITNSILILLVVNWTISSSRVYVIDFIILSVEISVKTFNRSAEKLFLCKLLLLYLLFLISN